MVRKSLTSGRTGHLAWAPARVLRNALMRAVPTSLLVKEIARPLAWRPADGLVDVTPIRPGV
jgi:hypothetical protein